MAIIVFFSSQTTSDEVPTDNFKCLKCHSKNYYSFQNDVTGKKEHKKMNPYFIINNKKFNDGVHNEFNCTACHVEEYEAYPHDSKLKLEAKYGCIDCHGDDETFAKFHFDEINIQVQESVHGKALGDDFKCEMCHNPHYYQPASRTKKNIADLVEASNSMCTECHNYNPEKYYLLSDSCSGNQDITHSWLPSKEIHFQKVRCIECHGSFDNEIEIPHNIMDKKNAIKECVDCHSTNSILMASLYRHQAKESRDKYGFFNGAMMNDSFVFGANNNYYLNAASIIIFSILMLVLVFHAILRIILKK